MQQRIGRRALLRKIASGFSASLFLLTVERRTQESTEAAAREICFWQYQYAICQGGQVQERWCYICCAGIDCETLVCEWRPAGSC